MTEGRWRRQKKSPCRWQGDCTLFSFIPTSSTGRFFAGCTSGSAFRLTPVKVFLGNVTALFTRQVFWLPVHPTRRPSRSLQPVALSVFVPGHSGGTAPGSDVLHVVRDSLLSPAAPGEIILYRRYRLCQDIVASPMGLTRNPSKSISTQYVACSIWLFSDEEILTIHE